jgi:hypothetical protein
MSKKLDPRVAEKVMLKAGLKPLEPYVNSGTKWKCKCLNCGGIVFPRYSSIKNGFGGCLECGLTKMKLKQRTPEKEVMQVMKKAGFQPLEPYKNANSKWKCKCLKCGKSVSITYGNIRNGNSGRKQCCSSVAVISKHDAIKKFAAQGFILLQPYTTSSASLKVRCKKCQKISKRSYQSLQVRGKKPRCVWCANLRKDPVEVVQFMKENGFKPTTSYKGANESWRCLCLKCKKIVKTSYASVRDGRGCGYCKKNIIDPKDARKNMISWGYKPLEPYKGTHENWKSMHIPCKNIVNPQYAQLKQMMGGCRHCAEWGFQYDKESYLYLITHKKLGAHKIGLGNIAKKLKADRLHRLKIEGWEVSRVWNFNEGKKALMFEKQIFRILRKDLKLPIFLSKDQIRNEGYSETIDADSITLSELEMIIKKVVKGYRQ